MMLGNLYVPGSNPGPGVLFFLFQFRLISGTKLEKPRFSTPGPPGGTVYFISMDSSGLFTYLLKFSDLRHFAVPFNFRFKDFENSKNL